MTMHVFVTGASGFIGAHLVPVLLSAGCEVAILAVPDDPLWRLSGVINQIRIIHGDLSAIDGCAESIADFHPDVCFHLAWYVEPGKYLDSHLNIDWVTYSLNLLKLLIQIGCQQVVMTGTCAEYDADVGYLKETSPTNPTTLYAAAKLSLSLLGREMAKGTGTKFVWARLFYLYGAKEDDRRVVPALIKSLLHDTPFAVSTGEQIRDYMHVEDVASAFWFIAEHQLSGVFNISSGKPVTMRALIEMIGDILGQKDLIRFGTLAQRQWEPPFICGDNQKLRELGWQPQYSLHDGLMATTTWWKNAEKI